MTILPVKAGSFSGNQGIGVSGDLGVGMEIRNPSFFEAPEFWKSDWDDVNSYLDTLNVGDVWEIGRSEGGHPIRAIRYGEKEPVERTATYSSAMAAGHPQSFFDPEKRKKPVLVIISTIHGAEVEGTVACLNCASAMETGVDLRGRRWDALREAALSVRLVLVPIAQPDGRIRIAVKNMIGATVDDLYYYGQGVTKSGEILTWPACKRMQPIPVDEMAFLGGYYNDAGVNIQHDDFFAPHVASETRALINLVQDETPDCVMSLHSCGSGPFFTGPDNFIPQAYQYRQAQIAAVVAERHRRDGLRPGGGAKTGPTGSFYFHTALHHTSGALPLLFEFPHGLQMKPFTFDEILDIGLSLFEEVMHYGITYGFRPK
ncbi:MAG: M14 family zinc carboxypeptidase [Candidatus Poribacteria bacterium]